MTGTFERLLWAVCVSKPPDLDLAEELAEAAAGVDLEALGQLQDELHDDGLVGHLLHQRVFLKQGRTE